MYDNHFYNRLLKTRGAGLRLSVLLCSSSANRPNFCRHTLRYVVLSPLAHVHALADFPPICAHIPPEYSNPTANRRVMKIACIASNWLQRCNAVPKPLDHKLHLFVALILPGYSHVRIQPVDRPSQRRFPQRQLAQDAPRRGVHWLIIVKRWLLKPTHNTSDMLCFPANSPLSANTPPPFAIGHSARTPSDSGHRPRPTFRHFSAHIAS